VAFHPVPWAWYFVVCLVLLVFVLPIVDEIGRAAVQW
jgi:hypothetical protein